MVRKRQAPADLPRIPTGKAGGIALMAGAATVIALLVLGGAAWLATSLGAAHAHPRVAFLVVAHDAPTLSSAARLLDAIYDPENLYFVHVDKKFQWPSDRSPADTMAPVLRGRKNIKWAQLADVSWGRWSMNEPTLWGMREALEHDFDVFINLSGDAWPVLTPSALRATLHELRGLNFVTSGPSCDTGLRPTGRNEFGDGWHKKQAYPHPMLPDEPSLEAFYGSQWMVVTRAFCQHVIQDLDTPGSVSHKLRRWFVNGTTFVEGVGRVKPHIPDETFFPTVLMTSGLRVPKPVEVVKDHVSRKKVPLRAVWYVRMDEHYPWSSHKQRYTSARLDRKERPWGPYYVGSYDLGDIRYHRALFVRKTSRNVDGNIFTVLPVDDYADIPDLKWPSTPVALSEPETYDTVTRGAETGCVRVAESIHCPPVHALGADVASAEKRARRYAPGEL
jgi:hypothetical protein